MSKPEPKIKDWINAARLRTLPLAFSCIIMGTALSFNDLLSGFSFSVFLLTLLTTLFLQVLSNWANDYGDFVKGTDNETRIGPERSLQSGAINSDSMRNAIIIMSFSALLSGIILLYLSGILMSSTGMLFLIFGLIAIWAAIRYTAGNNPYGYAGLGDMAVFFFFGLLGVLGSAFLHTHEIPDILDVFPAASIGFLSAAVLNLNNMRDAKDDASKGKRSMAVRLGRRTSKIYHACLVTLGVFCLIFYKIIEYQSPLDFLFILLTPILVLHIMRVMKNRDAKELDPELRVVAISTFSISVLFLVSELV